ncbi:hypothetical protein EMIT0194P_320015 [Pseudomonas serbica]
MWRIERVGRLSQFAVGNFANRFALVHVVRHGALKVHVEVGLNIIEGTLFNRPTTHFLKATRPCAVAYGYARIRRLVRLGAAR